MHEPSERNSKLALAGGLALALVVGGIGLLIGRASVDTRPPVETAHVVATPAPEPPVRVLGRADLLALAAAAADRTASGTPLVETASAIGSRRFSMTLPFACGGAETGEEGDTIFWQYDPERRVLKLRTTLTRWQPADWWTAESAPADVTAISGLWIPRPWSSAESCPPAMAAVLPSDSRPDSGPNPESAPQQTASAPAQATPTPASPAAETASQTTPPPLLAERTLAIAQFMFATSPRSLLRDGRPLEADIRMPADFTMPATGLRLRLTGRIDPLRTDAPVHCMQPEGPQQRPVCLLIATIEEAIIENPETGARLTSWPIGG